jgi:hypothetical protein
VKIKEWSSLLHRYARKDPRKFILYLYEFLLIFKVRNQFGYLNQFKKDLKSPHNAGSNLARGLALLAWPNGQSSSASPS